MEAYFIRKKDGTMVVIDAPTYCGPTNDMTWLYFIKDNDLQHIDIGDNIPTWTGMAPETNGLYYAIITIEERVYRGYYEGDEYDLYVHLDYFIRVSNRAIKPRLLKRYGDDAEHETDTKKILPFVPDSEYWDYQQYEHKPLYMTA